MEKRNNKISIAVILLMLVLLTINTVSMTMSLSPHHLSPLPVETYTIEFSILFGTDESSEQFHHQNSYLANEFYCYLTETNEYLIAEYDETEKCYVLIDYTDDKEQATVFKGGMSIDNTKVVTISGLPADNYTINHAKSTEGYTVIRDPIEINITEDGATVTGAAVDITADNRIIFRIMLTPGYDLPNCCSPGSSTYLVVTSISAFVLIASLLILIIMCINYNRRKNARLRARANDNTMENVHETSDKIPMRLTDFDGNETPIDAIINEVPETNESVDEMPELKNNEIANPVETETTDDNTPNTETAVNTVDTEADNDLETEQ